MMTNFSVDRDGQLIKQEGSLAEAIWIDILAPSLKEREQLEKEVGVTLPLHHEMHQLEFSNRFYEENNALYLTVNVVTKAFPIPESHIVIFVLTQNKLITLRYSDPNPIQTMANPLDKHKHTIKSHFDIFHLLLEKLIGGIADMFELVGEHTDTLSLSLIGSISNSNPKSNQSNNLNKKLHEINYLQSLLAKGYQSLTSYRLLIVYFQENQERLFSTTTPFIDVKIIDRDIISLSKHGDYLTQKLGFQLQSTLGLINIEQTHIIKIFTVLAMVFMPPTLIASIYGMNFHNMPELNWRFSYPIVLIIMLLSAFLPYRFFKEKGWV